MAKDMYNPSDNYERNFLLVKKCGSKFFTFFIPFLMFLGVLCMAYLSITKREIMEVTLLKVVTTKINPNLELRWLHNAITIISTFTSLYFIMVFLSVRYACKDPSPESSPDFGLSLAKAWSVIQLLFFGSAFAFELMFILIFTVKGPEFFDVLWRMMNIDVYVITPYKTSVTAASILISLLTIMMIWLSQSQLEFVRSVLLTLVQSVAKNKGAHTYGVFMMSISAAIICFAGVMTFIYYCYKDALVGFGVNLDGTYAAVSLALAFIRGLTPFLVAICAFTYSEMVNEANTLGTVYYNNVNTFGTVEDPNMNRRK